MSVDEATIARAASKIPIQNVWYMLLYVWDMAGWKGQFKAEAESSPSLLGLLARILAESTERLVRQQLRRSHEPHHETIRGIRGRIDFATCIKKRTFEKGAASCYFSELSVDTLKNRILLATLHRLSRDYRIEYGVQGTQSAELRQKLRMLIQEMQGVTLTPVCLSDFSRLQLTRNDRDYFIPLKICSFIQRLEMPNESSGDHAVVSLLRDEIKFCSLFERFVLNFYRINLPESGAASETLKWPGAESCRYMPVMKTDITLKSPTDSRRVVIDAKYYLSLFATSQHGSDKFRSGHLYQLYAYLRTQEESGDKYKNTTGMLLYPTTTHDIHETVDVQGHRIRIETLDLNQSWENIEKHLLDIVN